MRYCAAFCAGDFVKQQRGGQVRTAFCQWRIQDGRPGARIPRPARTLVVETGSLTAALRSRCPKGFDVQVYAQGWMRPSLEEAWRLHVPRRRLAWVREVALRCHAQPLILARTVIPEASLRGGNETLRHLGNRPLGELLFRGAGSRREALEVARLRPRDWLADRWGPIALSSSAEIWARRALHYLRGRPMLVTEVFLPELLHCQP